MSFSSEILSLGAEMSRCRIIGDRGADGAKIEMEIIRNKFITSTLKCELQLKDIVIT